MRYDYVAAYKSATGREPSPEQIESYIYTYSDTDADYVLFQKALQGAMEAVGGTWCPGDTVFPPSLEMYADIPNPIKEETSMPNGMRWGALAKAAGIPAEQEDLFYDITLFYFGQRFDPGSSQVVSFLKGMLASPGELAKATSEMVAFAKNLPGKYHIDASTGHWVRNAPAPAAESHTPHGYIQMMTKEFTDMYTQVIGVAPTALQVNSYVNQFPPTAEGYVKFQQGLVDGIAGGAQ